VWPLTVRWGGVTAVFGADLSASSLTDATLKGVALAFPHYTNAEEPVAMLVGFGEAGNNTLRIGGGAGGAAINAVTRIQFWLAATNTTVTGTEQMRLTTAGLGLGTTSFGSSAEKVLSVGTGTAPTTGPADTVQFYSSDDSAGNTVPSFYCEGSGVVATGQSDSASSVRVKMRINGTVRTFLCI
jgi:hypothetical protein